MNIFQFLRILWARRLVVAAATISCVIGAVIVVLIVPPRYEAKSRVLLETFKPDPVTGQSIAPNALRVFTRTQVEMIKDLRVAGRVVDELGWITDPGLIRAYRAAGGGAEFRKWAAQRVSDNTEVKLVEGSNILEISYASASPEQSRAVADTLRKAYIDVSLELRREAAVRNAVWYETQTEAARGALTRAEAAKTAYEKESGVVLPEIGADVESARLQALASSVGIAPVAAPQTASAMATQLAQADAALQQAERQLGPNHPDLQALRAQRAVIAQAYQREQAQLSGAAGAAGAAAGAVERAVQTQKARVIANRDVVERLRQLQTDVNVRREQFEKTALRAAELRREAAANDVGLTPLGSAATPRSPSFPNKPLILGGALALGLGLGVGLAIVIELFARRVRGYDDLAGELDAPVLAVIRAQPRARAFLTNLTPRRPGRALAPPETVRA